MYQLCHPEIATKMIADDLNNKRKGSDEILALNR